MSPRFVHPNLHVILIHYPLALLTLGVLIEIFSFLWRTSSFRTAGRWMILLGTLALVPAATSGIYALHDVATHGGSGDQHWSEIEHASNITAEQWDMVRDHVLLNCIAAGIALFTVVGWIGCSDRMRKRLHWPAVLLLVVAMAFMAAGAWHGGEMVFREGMGINGRAEVIKASALPDQSLTTEERIDKYVSPMQLHVILAGLVFAIAAAALGVSIRGVVQARALYAPGQLTIEDADLAALPPPVPVSRFWLIAAVVAVLTIAAGLWVGDYFKPGAFVPDIQRTFTKMGHDHARKALHIIFGGSILVLAILMAILARWAPRGRGVLAVCASLLVLVMAAQVWVGILLLYDSPRGPLTGFQPSSNATITQNIPGHAK